MANHNPSQENAGAEAPVLRIDRNRTPSPGAAAADSIALLESATVMMVDDEETTIDVLEMALQDAGYRNFVRETDSRNAMATLARVRPDVVLLDLNMPHVGGFEILQQVRNDETLRYSNIIILTSSTDADTKLKALELGATDFLGKPVDPSELALRLRNTLAAKAYQDRLRYYDPLTGLPNRLSLSEQMTRALRRVDHDRSSCALLYLDLQRFQKINDALGRDAGDLLLKSATSRIEESVRPGDVLGDNGIIARVGGDEFALFLPWVRSAEDARRIAKRVMTSFERPFLLDRREIHLGCTVGIAFYPDDSREANELLTHAEIAMTHAGSATAGYEFYNARLNAESAERLELENLLRGALDRNEICLHYQPKIDLQTQRVVGAEALMRWEHPVLGELPPARFIPLAEETGSIRALGGWAIREACQQIKCWREIADYPLSIAVNVSADQFQYGDLSRVVSDALSASGIDPSLLTLELTESILMVNPERTAEVLGGFREMGVRISIDDFGTGYSSLAYLKRFPISELKIDYSFVKGVPDDNDDASIVRSIIALAHGLGLSVVAEGVERQDQLEFMRSCDCDQVQGFLFSPPIPKQRWNELLAERAKAP
ncbi:MAG: EAL domain-containing protein [Myxococcales bacterium]|nr:EAL domain-containing protein [Myxococcales bacterium]